MEEPMQCDATAPKPAQKHKIVNVQRARRLKKLLQSKKSAKAILINELKLMPQYSIAKEGNLFRAEIVVNNQTYVRFGATKKVAAENAARGALDNYLTNKFKQDEYDCGTIAIVAPYIMQRFVEMAKKKYNIND